jgi:hypothetical protein
MQVQPYRVAGLELLSTALWHLKQDVDLSFLAQKVSPSPSRQAQKTGTLTVPPHIHARPRCSRLHATPLNRMDPLQSYGPLTFHPSIFALQVVELDRRSAQCWCVVGNCFSLHKEHETALRFFQRALQLDPHFTYAYTLCGHEYVCNEDFDKAVACFRYAIRIDERHYNAWYVDPLPPQRI